MRRAFSWILCVLLLGGCAACGWPGPATGQSVPYPNSPITAITFHSIIDNAGDCPVPEADLEEITTWLSAFKVGVRVGKGKNMVPGTGSVEMTLTYADGTSERRSLDIIRLNGVAYHVKYPNAPECYVTLLNSKYGQ